MIQLGRYHISVTVKELLGIVKSINHAKHNLLSKKFLLRADHNALNH